MGCGDFADNQMASHVKISPAQKCWAFVVSKPMFALASATLLRLCSLSRHIVEKGVNSGDEIVFPV